jgi:hypothetical protein
MMINAGKNPSIILPYFHLRAERFNHVNGRIKILPRSLGGKIHAMTSLKNSWKSVLIRAC